MRQLLTDLRGNPIYYRSHRRPAAQRRCVYRHPNLPVLFYRVQNRAWDDVVRRAQTHGHEVTIQEDVSGNTPLHIACRLDPPSHVVQALIGACRHQNAEGATPLHIASTHRCSAAVIQVLLQENDEATSCLTKTGRAPIHYACMSFRGLGVEAFQLLLDETLQKGNVEIPQTTPTTNNNNDDDDDEFDLLDEEDIDSKMNDLSLDVERKEEATITVNVMTMRDGKGQTPLGLLFRRYKERVRCVIKTIEKLHSEHSATPTLASIATAITVQADLGELWQKARIIVGKLTQERLQREEGIVGSGEDDQQQQHGQHDRSPAEEAIAQEAAAWASERHRRSLLLRRRVTTQSNNGVDDNGSSAVVLQERQFRIVHASVGLTGYGCPPELIRLAISIHPNQVQEMDEDGNLPLHIAAVACSCTILANSSNTSTSRHNSNNNNGTAAAAVGDEDSSVLSSSDLSLMSSATTTTTGGNAVSSHAFDKVISILLRHYPAAARIPHGRTGRLPLVMAMEAKRRTWQDGIKTLLDAYPAALESRRIRMEGLYPHILSLIGNRDHVRIVGLPKQQQGPQLQRQQQYNSRTMSTIAATSTSGKKRHRQALTTLFELIKAKPDLVRNMGRAAELSE